MIFAACGNKTEQNQQQTVDMVRYQNDDFGYQMEIPENWSIQSSEDKSQIYVVSSDNTLALNVICEIGGFNYYTPKDLAMTIAEKTTASFTDTAVVLEEEIEDYRQSYRVVVNGKNEDGVHTVVDVSLLQPIEGIHHYLIFSGGIEDYQGFAAQWEEMLHSFIITKTPEELYQKAVK